jgi:hypothetical protein
VKIKRVLTILAVLLLVPVLLLAIVQVLSLFPIRISAEQLAERGENAESEVEIESVTLVEGAVEVSLIVARQRNPLTLTLTPVVTDCQLTFDLTETDGGRLVTGVIEQQSERVEALILERLISRRAILAEDGFKRVTVTPEYMEIQAVSALRIINYQLFGAPLCG